jgi:hypothetical protein
VLAELPLGALRAVEDDLWQPSHSAHLGISATPSTGMRRAEPPKALSVPLAPREPAKGDEPDERDDQPDPEAPDNDQDDPENDVARGRCSYPRSISLEGEDPSTSQEHVRS